jgi:suppressor of ftsI
MDTTIHWHGLRLRQEFDGVPDAPAPAVPPGAAFRYTISTPDEGLFWYHPHVREDLQQELGLAGLIVVEGPRSSDETWPKEVPLVLDDVKWQANDVAPFSPKQVDHAMMGRYGNFFLTNGQTRWTAPAAPGERVRLLLLDAANARPFNISFPGAASVEQVASDGGFLLRPLPVPFVVLGPGERATVDVVMPAHGDVAIVHSVPRASREMGRLAGIGAAKVDAGAPAGPHNRASASIEQALQHKARAADASLVLDLRMAERAMPAMPGMDMGTASPPPAGSVPDDGIEWVPPSGSAAMDAMTTRDLQWIIRDNSTGRENQQLEYYFERGTLALFNITNLDSSMHPMQHPMHLHGQRFLVTDAEGMAMPPLAWKDTVLIPAGASVQLLVDLSNPGTWMLHCHISEHLEDGMAATVVVQ